MKSSLLSALVALALAPSALASGFKSAWRIETAPASAPDDILGEHQPLARSWTVASSGCALDTLYLALPGRVFVELDPSALPPPPVVETEPPVVDTEPPVVDTEPPVVDTEPPVVPTTEPPVPVTEVPLPILPPPVAPVNGSGSGSGSFAGLSTVQLRRHEEDWEDDEDYEDECRSRSKKKGKKDKKHKKQDEEEESSTVYIRIVVTGDSPELLDMIEAVPLHPRRSDALKLHLANADAEADGYLLTTVYVLNPRSLRSITTAFDGEVVVDDRVLAISDDRHDFPASDDDEEDEEDEDEYANSRLSLVVVGNANLYVAHPVTSRFAGKVSFGSLNVVVTGSGTIQLPFLTGAVVALGKSLDIDVAGSGTVAAATQAVSLDSLSASVTGSGVIVIESTADVTVKSIVELSVFGSGALSVSTSGTVEKEKLELSGAGQLLAGSIVAKTADVSVWGSGLVLVQAVQKLTVSTSVWGAVGYVNIKPATIKIDGWWFWRSADEIVYPATQNVVLAPKFSGEPPKYPTYYAVATHFSKRDDDPDYTIVTTEPEDEDDSSSSGIVSMAVAAVSAKAESATGLSATSVAALAVAVVALVAVAARSFEQFRVRRQYTRLL